MAARRALVLAAHGRGCPQTRRALRREVSSPADVDAGARELNAELADLLGELGDPDWDVDPATPAPLPLEPHTASLSEPPLRPSAGGLDEARLAELLRAHHDRVIAEVRLLIDESNVKAIAALRHELQQQRDAQRKQ